MPIKFSINNTVRVRLTKFGRDLLRQNHQRLFGDRADDPNFAYKPPEEIDGWATFQLWKLMEVFGPHIHHAMVDMPFETEIELVGR